MEYTDLELEEKIADLEGFEVCKVNTTNEILFIKSKGFCHTDNVEFDSAEPYYVDLFNLMVKYKVGIDSGFSYAEIDDGKFYNQQSFKEEAEIPRAIIMCILKSKNII